VPFVEATAGMDVKTKRRVSRKMLTTATVVGVILLVFGEIMAGGIILLIIAVHMVLSSGDSQTSHGSAKPDPDQLAVYPLAVPYLLNPAGIVALVTLSSEASSIAMFGVVAGILALVLVIDVLVFRWADSVSKHLDQGRMLITEKVFGFLLAALAVQLVLNGLEDAGVIHLAPH
jgi:small neutral amino acid transporter SnatA (MarC family)